MDDLSGQERQLLLTALKVAYGAHRKVYQEATAAAADREISKHYRRMANQDANWAANQMSRLSSLDGKLRLLLAREREAA